MQDTLPLPLYILIYDIQYSKEGCLLPRTWGWKVYPCHLQGCHLLKARTYPSYVKRFLCKCSWINSAIGYVRVCCRVYTFIYLPVSSVSLISRIRIGWHRLSATAAFLISPLRVTYSGYTQSIILIISPPSCHLICPISDHSAQYHALSS